MPRKQGFPTFKNFINAVESAKPKVYLKHPSAKVNDETAFREMQAHIIKLYEGVEVKHSFTDANGQVFDCIPIEQQPSLRGSSEKAATPPELPPLEEAKDSQSGALLAEPPLGPDKKDQYGNKMWCPTGTIPMRRITLEEMIRFESSRNFFQKAPGGGRHPRLSGPREEDVSIHKYAHAYQSVVNSGAYASFNIWQPVVGANQIFSLSQMWVTGGSGAQLQTVETGWIVYPTKFGTSFPVLFIYWTANNYQNTGCYNLDCIAFRQIYPEYALGMALTPVSVPNGNQYEYQLSWYRYEGNWWLNVDTWWVGYYPASLFGQGQLTNFAQNIDFGGETVGDVNNTTWPPMGSGSFASAGTGQAAYQRMLKYYDTSGVGNVPSLTPNQPSPSCYTINLLGGTTPSNPAYFFFGGPGGTTC